MTCFTWILALFVGIFILISLIRWFEQVHEAVRNGWWNKTALLVLCPFAVWLYQGKVALGRPVPVPPHEPVRGFGIVPSKAPPQTDSIPTASIAPSDADDQPPPGTPPEFLVKPQVPPKKPRGSAIDSDKIAKLRQKMKEQGLIDEEE